MEPMASAVRRLAPASSKNQGGIAERKNSAPKKQPAPRQSCIALIYFRACGSNHQPNPFWHGFGCRLQRPARLSGVGRSRGATATQNGHGRPSATCPRSFRPKVPIHPAFFPQEVARELPLTYADGE
jgi:hypothetical protein